MCETALPVYSTEKQREIIAGLKQRLPEDAPTILLEHMPRIIHAAQEEDIDLVLSGHSHGGQVRIPFGPAIETPSDLGVWISKGLYKFKSTYLYINPGIGLEPGPAYILVRFWCRSFVKLGVLLV
jgi:predicted MPP superfamily phosphohydrolase